MSDFISLAVFTGFIAVTVIAAKEKWEVMTMFFGFAALLVGCEMAGV